MQHTKEKAKKKAEPSFLDSPKSESSSVKAGSDVRGSPDGVGDEQIDKTIVPYGSVDEGNAGFIATPLHKEDLP